jgi:hypothetical protein
MQPPRQPLGMSNLKVKCQNISNTRENGMAEIYEDNQFGIFFQYSIK